MVLKNPRINVRRPTNLCDLPAVVWTDPPLISCFRLAAAFSGVSPDFGFKWDLTFGQDKAGGNGIFDYLTRHLTRIYRVIRDVVRLSSRNRLQQVIQRILTVVRLQESVVAISGVSSKLRGVSDIGFDMELVPRMDSLGNGILQPSIAPGGSQESSDA